MGEKIATAAAVVGLAAIGGYIGAGYAVWFGASKLAGAAIGALIFPLYPLTAGENN